MNNFQVNRALAEMRSIAAQAAGQSQAPAKAEPGGFGETLKNAIGQVNELQQTAGQNSDAFIRGDNIPLTEVMVSLQKSKVAFTAVKEVRNHLLEAYREVSRMQV